MPEKPYKGLMPYSEEDAEYFFGRDRERDIIIANLMASRLTLLYGVSGVGKTSILNAGVAFKLREEARENLNRFGTPESIVVLFSSWKDDLLSGLVQHISDSVKQVYQNRPVQVPSRSSLIDNLKDWTEQTNSDLLIILDQFEEYFLYHGHQNGGAAFADELARASRRMDLRVSFLLSIREDALAKLDRFKGRIPNLFDNYLRIKYLDRQSAKKAIEEPIKKFNDLAEKEGDDPLRIHIEPHLADAVLDDLKAGEVEPNTSAHAVLTALTRSNASEGGIETAYLQLVMTKLWKEERSNNSTKLRLETLKRLGGPKTIVKNHVDEVMKQHSGSLQSVASAMFDYMITPEGGKIAVTASALANWTKLARGKIEKVLKALSEGESRILRSLPEGRYELFHDQLAPAILKYVARQQKTRAQKRWLKTGAGILVAILIVFGGIVGWFYISNAQLREDALKSQLVLEQKEKQALEEQSRKVLMRQEAEAAYKVGSQYLLKKEYAAALTEFQKAESLFRQGEVVSRQAEALIAIGSVHASKKEFSEAKKLYNQAREMGADATPRDYQTEGRALEKLASLEEQDKKMEMALPLYDQAQKIYKEAGAFLSRGRILERMGIYFEGRNKIDQARSRYSGALASYEAADDLAGTVRTKNALKSLDEKYMPWGFLLDLQDSHMYELKGSQIEIGRKTPNVKTDISFETRYVSRHHLVIRRDLSAEDLRSRNGTAINGRLVPYGVGRKLEDGDIITLANVKALQFTTKRPTTPVHVPSDAWAMFIDNQTKSFHYLTEPEYSVTLANASLSLQTGLSDKAYLKLRRQPKGEIFDTEDDWYAIATIKETDYEYKSFPISSVNWIEVVSAPLQYVKLSPDGKRIVEEGPSFQIIPLAIPPASAFD